MSVAALDVSGTGCPPVDLPRVDSEDRRRDGRPGQTRKACRAGVAALRKNLACGPRKTRVRPARASATLSRHILLGIQSHPARLRETRSPLAGRALFLAQSLRDRCQFQAVATIA